MKKMKNDNKAKMKGGLGWIRGMRARSPYNGNHFSSVKCMRIHVYMYVCMYVCGGLGGYSPPPICREGPHHIICLMPLWTFSLPWLLQIYTLCLDQHLGLEKWIICKELQIKNNSYAYFKKFLPLFKFFLSCPALTLPLFVTCSTKYSYSTFTSKKLIH